jgi:hypothetical protein
VKAIVAPQHSFSAAEDRRAEINMSQIRVGGGAVGLLFAGGTVYIFFAGVPELRWFLAGAGVAGAVISVALAILHRYKPSRPAPSISN